MSLIIENGKVIKATGDANQIIADFNEYLEFVRETTIPVPKDQFTNLNENRAKLYNDHMEAIKANKDLQEEIKNLKHAHTLNILENNKEASTIIAKRAAEIDKLKEENEKLKKKVSLYECVEEVRKCIKETNDAEMRHQYDDDLYRLLNVLSSIDDEESKDDLSPKSTGDANSNSDSYKYGDLAFIIRRASAGPTDDDVIIHITLAVYNGFTWGSLEGHVVETDCADIVPIDTANYLIDYFGTPNTSCTVRYHY